ncbi:hypothetical protein AB0H43_22020 [Hamadaea sp. NPDC050747]|uniref:hypothetical protein n=1 Tax=Hamadaea sp. NPDC050747 TaxID=3155789 RepID=UPI0033D2599E
MDDFDVHLRAWLLLVVVTAVLVAAAWYDGRRRRPGDVRGWKPAQAAIVDRCAVSRETLQYCRLTVRFRTWRGHWAYLVAEVPAAQAPSGDEVWVLYDPLRPQFAQLSLRQPRDE